MKGQAGWHPQQLSICIHLHLHSQLTLIFSGHPLFFRLLLYCIYSFLVHSTSPSPKRRLFFFLESYPSRPRPHTTCQKISDLPPFIIFSLSSMRSKKHLSPSTLALLPAFSRSFVQFRLSCNRFHSPTKSKLLHTYQGL
jgi:hypothetical protein